MSALIAALAASSSALATPLYTESDPAFEGAVLLTFESDDISNTATSLTATQDGVTFQFDSYGTPPPYIDGATFLDHFDALLSNGNGTQGLTLTISPPVSAIGFYAEAIDGCPGATFQGADGDETVNEDSVYCSYNSYLFFAAVGNGDVHGVDLKRQSSIWAFDGVFFVPPGVIPTEKADVSVTHTVDDAPFVSLLDDVAHSYETVVHNAGPDTAPTVFLHDYLARGMYDSHIASAGTVTHDTEREVLRLESTDLASTGNITLTVDATTPTWPAWWCGARQLDLVMVSTDVLDEDLTDNVAWVVTRFDNEAQADAFSEICGNGRDDDCDGAADCMDNACSCPPMLIQLGGGTQCSGEIPEAPPIPELLEFFGTCAPSGQPAQNRGCTVPRGTCGTVTVPAWCCDPGTWSDPANNGNMSSCDVGVPGCTPHDPNWLDSVPHANLWGYGYIQAGDTIDYIVHYENTGNADAHDVLIIDALPDNVDDASLVIDDGGVYDADTRTIVWSDPVLPPDTPRDVGFSIDVDSDAGTGTRVRNIATIVFPDAVPPERTDTNFVEHVIPAPGFDPTVPDLRVIGCTETAIGSGTFTVDLVNHKTGFAFNVKATMVDGPLDATDTEVTLFEHPDDLEAGPRTVIPNAVTTSTDTVAFTSDVNCGEITWHITWEDFYGNESSADVNASDIDTGDTGGGDTDEGVDETGECGCSNGGCGCATGGPGALGAFPLLALLGSRRRRV